MNHKQKLIYMALGCLFTLIGYTLATLTTNVTAQTDDTSSEATFDKITCKSLSITDGSDENRIILVIGESGGVIRISGKDAHTDILGEGLITKGTGGAVGIMSGLVAGVKVSEPNGKASVLLGADPSGAWMFITDKNKTTVSSMGVSDKGGGLIELYDQHEKSQIQLSFSDYGGRIAIFNKGKENVLQASVGDKGDGIISTRDKNGYRTGKLP